MSKDQKNLERLVELTQTVLRSKGKTKSSDTEGNVIYVDCDIYDRNMLETFVHLSLSNFNQIPYFTFYTLEDAKFIDLFTEVLVEGAVLYALGSQALLERGREFQITNGSIHFDPPGVSELLNTQYSTLLQHHFEKLKLIKGEIKSVKFTGKK
jgi:hypothetical protein